MQISNYLKQAVPHTVAIAIFLFITVLYFYPVIEGKVLHTNDATVSLNSSQEIIKYREKYGEEPLWTNSMFGGMPAYLISTIYKGNIMRPVNAFLTILKLPVASIFLSMLGFYILLLIFRVDWRLAIAGAIAYGLSTYFFFILEAGHNTKAIAIAYMAPMIGGIYYTYRYNALKGALLTAFFLTLEIIANHLQITYYAFLCILIFIIVEFIFSVKKKKIASFLKRSLILLVPILLAVGMNFGSIYTTYEYGQYSTRSKTELHINNPVKTTGLDRDYVTTWSYGIDETLTLLIPNFKGGASIPFGKDSRTITVLRKNNAGQYANQFLVYWGTQPNTGGPVYVGAIIVFLFVLGLIIIKGPEKWWLLAATLLAIMLAWGKNFMPFTNLFLDYFPGYDKFRAVTMTLVIAEFCMPLLGILALRDIFDGKISKDNALKGVKIAFGVTGGITLLFVLLPGLAGSFISSLEKGNLPEWLSASLVADRKQLLRSDSFRSFVLILLAASTIFAFYKEKVKKEYAIVFIAVLFLFDMFLVDKRYLNADKFMRQEAKARLTAPTVADKTILQDSSYYRVLNLTVSPFNDASTSHFHKSVGGYHGAKLRRYQELIDSVLIKNILAISNVGRSAKTLEEFQTVFGETKGLNMINTKYLIISPDGPPLINEKALGNAWFAETAVMVDTPDEELSKINSFDPSSEAIIDNKFKDQLKSTNYQVSEGDTIFLTNYEPNELIYQSKTGGERLAVFSEIYYPAGWRSYIDGKESQYFRTNWTLRGMIVPAGEHEIKFVFKPSSYYTGNKVSMISSIIFILMVAGYILYSVRSKSRTV